MDKPSNQEDEYFAKEEIEKKRKLALDQTAALAQAQRDALKAAHFMKCPKCGMDLHTLEKGKVEIDACFHCHGVWLDAGELDALLKQGNDQLSRGVMGAVLNLFQRR